MSTRNIYCPRRAFTLVELLVVIAIITIMMGMLLPAVMNARSTARTSACMNNERNIAIAIINYHTGKQRLPYYAVQDNSNASWCVQILEELGLAKLARSVYEAENNKPKLLNEDISNIPELKSLKCPAGNAESKGISYVLNVGTPEAPQNTNQYKARTLFFYGYPKGNQLHMEKSIANISDGASDTIMLGESLRNTGVVMYDGLNNEVQNDQNFWPSKDWRFPRGVNTNSVPNDGGGGYTGKCILGILWNPNAQPNNSWMQQPKYFPRSRHNNVVNIAFADGSAKGINKQIFYQTYIRLMAPDDKACGYNWNSDYSNDPNFQQ